MEKFLIFQARQKDSSKTQSSKKEIANSDHKYVQRIWMTAEIMDKKLGAIKAASWRASGMIPHRPCPVTGKDDIDHKEWGVAKEYQIWSEGTNNTTAFEATASADEEDLKLFTSMASGSAASCTETPAATKENEDKSSLEQYNDKVFGV